VLQIQVVVVVVVDLQVVLMELLVLVVLAALYILIPIQKTLHGPITEGNENMKDLNLREKISIAPVIAIIVVMGFYPKPVLDLINPTSAKVVVDAGYSDPIAEVNK
jgi:NADH-quinone oxidoreductase subunit M